MRIRDAERLVKDRYGSVDEFVLTLIDDYPDYLDGETINPGVVAHQLGIPQKAFLRIQQSNDFAIALDRFAISQVYGITERMQSARMLSKAAQGEKKTVMTAKGELAEVDRSVSEMVKADSHLRDIAGRSVGKSDSPTIGGIMVVFGQPPEAEEVIDVDGFVHSEEPKALQVEGSRRYQAQASYERNEYEGHVPTQVAGTNQQSRVYKGSTPGSLPPAGARRAYENRGAPSSFESHLGLGVEPAAYGQSIESFEGASFGGSEGEGAIAEHAERESDRLKASKSEALYNLLSGPPLVGGVDDE